MLTEPQSVAVGQWTPRCLSTLERWICRQSLSIWAPYHCGGVQKYQELSAFERTVTGFIQAAIKLGLNRLFSLAATAQNALYWP